MFDYFFKKKKKKNIKELQPLGPGNDVAKAVLL